MKPNRLPTRADRQRARSRQVRVRLFNAGFICLLVLVLFFGVTIWQRNEKSVSAIEARLRREFADPLEKEITRLGGLLPTQFPEPEKGGVSYGGRYHYPPREDIRILRRAEQPVLVGHTGRTSLFFRGDGYHVVLFERGPQRGQWALRVEWWLEKKFCTRILRQRDWMADQRKQLNLQLGTTPNLP